MKNRFQVGNSNDGHHFLIIDTNIKAMDSGTHNFNHINDVFGLHFGADGGNHDGCHLPR